MATSKQRRAAKRNIKKAGAAAKRKQTLKTAAEKDADCAGKTSGEIEKGEVPAGTKEVKGRKSIALQPDKIRPPGDLALCL